MYKYTPNPAILKSLKLAQKKPYGKTGSATWNLVNSYFSEYNVVVTFLQYWENTMFYSPKQLQQVPVMGIMFPVAFFKEEWVE